LSATRIEPSDSLEPLAVRMRGIVKRLGGTLVLDDLDLDVRVSEKLALIGPSGSGKSTVLRLLMGLEQSDRGELEIFGQHDLVRARQHVGMVFQHFNLFPHMTVLRNVTEAPVHVLGLDKREAQARAAELLQRVGMENKLEAYPAELSGGQKQRVAIARALAMQPRLMLFDEVTSALDPELAGEVVSVMRELAREHDMTMVIVTHQLDIAEEIADRVAFLANGRVVEQGPPSRVLRDPVEQRTREFVRRLASVVPAAEPA
jgi:polar amino acid transport system ATP-binding protein